jgi:hypothetical protein
VDVLAGPHGDLAAVVLGLADDPRDLLEAVIEHLAQQEDRALDRREALQEHQEPHRERVGGLGVHAVAGAVPSGIGHGSTR